MLLFFEKGTLLTLPAGSSQSNGVEEFFCPFIFQGSATIPSIHIHIHIHIHIDLGSHETKQFLGDR